MKGVAAIVLLGALVQTVVMRRPAVGSWIAGGILAAIAYAPWDRLNNEKRRR
jgi:hypothetical protein